MCGKMTVEIYPDRVSVGRAAAAAISREIRTLIERNGKAGVIFASAPSQNETLAALCDDRTIDWTHVIAFHLDEYVGVSAGHPTSFRRFLQEHLFDHVPIGRFHGLSGEASAPLMECRRYADLLTAERPGLAILGVGENGHLAFIDPPVCDFHDPADVRLVQLDEACRRQQVNDGAFARMDDVPRTALSLTVPYLMRVPRAIAIVPGPAKQRAIKAAVDGSVTTACPASILRTHSDATLFLDRDSAALLNGFQG